MIAALVLGALCGTASLLAYRGVWPARLSLAEDRSRRLRTVERPQPGRPSLTGLLAGVGEAVGLNRLDPKAAADLRIARTDTAAYTARRLRGALIGLAAGPAVTLLLMAAGVPVPYAAIAPLAFGCAGAGLIAPALGLRREAAQRRREFRYGLSAFLDVVALSLAAGAGIDSSLHTAATAGRGWVFAELRQVMWRARLHRETPWSALAQLGRDLDVRELRELAANVALAGDDGAKIRSSITSKAQAIRAAQLAETETAAEQAGERMQLPIVLLMASFVLFIGYPAVTNLLNHL